MGHSIAIPHHRPAGHHWGHDHHVALSVLLVLIIGGLGFAILYSTVDLVRGLFVEKVPEPRIEFPARELPREWQWRPRGVAVEHMYREHLPARLVRIREGRAR
jgi:hypothetical protein